MDPENQADSTTEMPTDPDMISASDILRHQAKTEEGSEPEPKSKQSKSDDEAAGEDEGTSEEDDDLNDESEETEEDDDEDDDLVDEGDEDKPKRLVAPKEIIEAMPAELKKRAEQWVAGVEKIETRNTEATRQLEGQIGTWNRLVEAENNLANPATAPAYLKSLVDLVARTHGLDVAKVLGIQAAKAGDEPEFEADRKLLDLAEKRIMDKLGINPGQLKDLLGERQTAAQKAAFEAHVNQVSDLTIARLKKFDGMTITKDMVAEAIRNLPQFAKTPAKAVRMWFTDERAKAASESQVRKAPKAPEALKGKGRAPVKDMPENPLDWKASDVLRLAATQ